MIKNSLKIAFRNIRRYMLHSVLNIAGMAIGMAAAILILLWVRDELSYDRDLPEAGNIYRLVEKDTSSQGSMMIPVPAALSAAMKQEIPEIIYTTRYTPSPLSLKKGDEYIEELVATVDKDFLKMFNLQFIDGDINTALDDPHSIILTEETAMKFFGDLHAVGKTIPSRGYDVKVTGVIKDIPANRNLRFKYLVPLQWLSELGAHSNSWQERFYTYVQVKKGTDPKTVERKIAQIVKTNVPESQSIIFMQNVKKIHLYSAGKYNYDVNGLGDIIYVRILALIAAFILVIACINFMSLSTAQSVQRSKETGIRKVTGAGRGKLIFQFLGEAMLMVFTAHIFAMILVELFLPGFNTLTGKQLFVPYHSAGLYLQLMGLIVLCGLLAGGYPALVLSAARPLDAIRGIVKKSPTNIRFRKLLVIFQFTMSVGLIICTLVIGLQLKFMQKKDIGYNRENIGYFMFPIRPGDPKLESLKKELAGYPSILGVTKGFNPSSIEGYVNGFNWNGKKEGNDISFCFVGGDADFASTFGFKIKQGRFFSPEINTDSSAVVINEKASEMMGLANPLGEVITTPWGARLTIIGIMKNFNFKSLRYAIEPLILQVGSSNSFFVRMKPGNRKSTLEFIDKTFKSFNPGLPMDFHFMDNDFENMYMTERRIGKIFMYFSMMAVFISCLGLIGLSSFMNERRTKEIGIRKVNGAKTVEIFTLLSGEYLIWVMISVFIAGPVAYYVMHKWLQNFAFRTHIPWWVLAVSGCIALFIALATVSLQSYRTSEKNPVDALRYE
ncbi:MAG TPA: ABC transporter permease [Bacteroidales bacterium]|nr:ABC transporter permease [Bacteroidales bacterium]